MDVPYRSLWGWIDDSKGLRQRYEVVREEQFGMIRVQIVEVTKYKQICTSLRKKIIK